ncbi:hypothetical protein B0H14DRAFT_2593928 [Mycena olivaceomarginata]|nr:hypothetical protein B0H14DRAFT_2593928 [Mycena olivaceomarginata]
MPVDSQAPRAQQPAVEHQAAVCRLLNEHLLNMFMRLGADCLNKLHIDSFVYHNIRTGDHNIYHQQAKTICKKVFGANRLDAAFCPLTLSVLQCKYCKFPQANEDALARHLAHAPPGRKKRDDNIKAALQQRRGVGRGRGDCRRRSRSPPPAIAAATEPVDTGMDIHEYMDVDMDVDMTEPPIPASDVDAREPVVPAAPAYVAPACPSRSF